MSILVYSSDHCSCVSVSHILSSPPQHAFYSAHRCAFFLLRPFIPYTPTHTARDFFFLFAPSVADISSFLLPIVGQEMDCRSRRELINIPPNKRGLSTSRRMHLRVSGGDLMQVERRGENEVTESDPSTASDSAKRRPSTGRDIMPTGLHVSGTRSRKEERKRPVIFCSPFCVADALPPEETDRQLNCRAASLFSFRCT